MKKKKFKVGDRVRTFDYSKNEWFKGTIKNINGNKITVDEEIIKNINGNMITVDEEIDISDDNIEIQIIKEYKGLKPKKMFVLYEYDERYCGTFKTLKEVESYLREEFDMYCRDDFKKFCADYKIVEEYRYM